MQGIPVCQLPAGTIVTPECMERVAGQWAKRVRWLSAAEMDAKLAMARANGRLPPEGLDAYLAQLGDA